jgi:hypothetical protein
MSIVVLRRARRRRANAGEEAYRINIGNISRRIVTMMMRRDIGRVRGEMTRGILGGGTMIGIDLRGTGMRTMED